MKNVQSTDFGGGGSLPTFGAKPRTEFPQFSNDGNVSTIVYINGRGYIAHVGIGGVGWRQIGDYLIAIYSATNGRALPVASFVVERRAVGLESVAVSIPSPYKNER
jgi:hypothetical protein